MNSAVIIMIMFAIIAFVVILEGATKEIPIQYAKSSNYGHKINSTIPIKLNAANVMPIIFASTIYSLPVMFFGNSHNKVLLTISKFFSSSAWFDADHWYYSIGFIVYGLLIVFFAYFYTSIIFNPVEVANNLKKSGAVIPGIRPGKATQDYIAKQIKYITFIGALFLFLIAEIPTLLAAIFHLQSLSFGGTSIIIVVGVITELTKIILSEKVLKEYKTSKNVLFGIKA
jgi:preprotein translocase subunit SecY